MVENFPKKTLFFVCLARAILALISTILNVCNNYYVPYICICLYA